MRKKLLPNRVKKTRPSFIIPFEVEIRSLDTFGFCHRSTFYQFPTGYRIRSHETRTKVIPALWDSSVILSRSNYNPQHRDGQNTL